MDVLERLKILAGESEELWALVIWMALGVAFYALDGLIGALAIVTIVTTRAVYLFSLELEIFRNKIFYEGGFLFESMHWSGIIGLSQYFIMICFM